MRIRLRIGDREYVRGERVAVNFQELLDAGVLTGMDWLIIQLNLNTGWPLVFLAVTEYGAFAFGIKSSAGIHHTVWIPTAVALHAVRPA